jgi:hypothetical protein
MGTVLAYRGGDEFEAEGLERPPKPSRKGKLFADSPAKRDAVQVASLDRQLSLFEAVTESVTLQKIWELLSAMWPKILEMRTKILELEQAIAASIERMAGRKVKVRGESLPVQPWYTAQEFADGYGLKLGTVRKYLLTGKLNGEKTILGRGDCGEWRISHQERLRYDEEGLLNEDPYREKNPDKPTNRNLKNFGNKKPR